jgi:hypothetical protein
MYHQPLGLTSTIRIVLITSSTLASRCSLIREIRARGKLVMRSSKAQISLKSLRYSKAIRKIRQRGLRRFLGSKTPVLITCLLRKLPRDS